MVTFPADRLGAVLFGKTRRAVLALMFNHPDQQFHLRQVCRRAGGGMGAVQRELRELTSAGILSRTARGNQSVYQANPACPIYSELKSMVTKTIGIADLLRTALQPIAEKIRVAFVFGSFSRGEHGEHSDVDLMIIGDVSFSQVVDLLHETQRALAREINPLGYSPAELRTKLAEKSHFVSNVLRGEKIFLIGDEHELGRLVQERLAQKAHARRASNRATAGGRPARPARRRGARAQ